MTEFDRAIGWILRNYGHNIMLQRREANGTSFRRQLERHTVRHMYPNTRGLPSILSELPEGRINVVDMIYFFKVDAKPREGDRIYEKDERFEGYVTNHGVNSGKTTWLIDYAVPLRGLNGKIIFWTAGVTRESPN